MRHSASALNTLSKCGYKYYLEKFKGLKEQGKRSYNMLLGDIVGTAIQHAAEVLHKTKRVSGEDIKNALIRSYQENHTRAGITPELTDRIITLIARGTDLDVMADIDLLSSAINSTQYEFVPPALLKNGQPSKDKKKPALSYTVIIALEAVHWFFDEFHAHYKVIRDADVVEAEKAFEVPIGVPYSVRVNDKVIEQRDTLSGRFDLYCKTGEAEVVYELKYTNTEYKQEQVNHLTQVLAYDYAIKGDVHLVDIKRQTVLKAVITDPLREMFINRTNMARLMVDNQIFLPACGSDPYTENSILCGFKCGGCPYATKELAC
jgi:hypothetical protein